MTHPYVRVRWTETLDYPLSIVLLNAEGYRKNAPPKKKAPAVLGSSYRGQSKHDAGLYAPGSYPPREGSGECIALVR